MRWIGRAKRRPVAARPRWWAVLFSATAAAWVQAVGALLAIGLTVSLAISANWDTARKAIIVAYFGMDAASNVFFQLRDGCDAHNREVVRYVLPQLEEASEILRQVNTQELPFDVQADVLTIRRHLAKARGVFGTIESDLSKTQIVDADWWRCRDYGAAMLEMTSHAAQRSHRKYGLDYVRR